jgi:multidrug transporter EmrE-like cation transporter
MVLFVAAFRRGGNMAVLYPIYASTFIWAALIALLAFDTPIKPVNIAGMALLVAGMVLMGC